MLMLRWLGMGRGGGKSLRLAVDLSLSGADLVLFWIVQQAWDRQPSAAGAARAWIERNDIARCAWLLISLFLVSF
jgi:hypothetical protein